MTNSDALSAVEILVLLRGAEIGDRTALKLILKELVARDYLTVVTVEEPRRLGPRKRTAVTTLGSTLGPAANPVLDGVLAVMREGRPQATGSAHQVLTADIEAAVRKLGDRPSLGKVREVAFELSQNVLLRAYPGGVVGVPLPELAAVVLRRHRPPGWYAIGWRRLTHGVVPGIVLPALHAARLISSERVSYVVTAQGDMVRAQHQERMRGGRAGSLERALAGELRLLAPTPHAVDAAFSAIDKSVESAWHSQYGN